MNTMNLARLIETSSPAKAETEADEALALGIAYYAAGRKARVVSKHVRRVARRLFRLDAEVAFS